MVETPYHPQWRDPRLCGLNLQLNSNPSALTYPDQTKGQLKDNSEASVVMNRIRTKPCRHNEQKMMKEHTNAPAITSTTLTDE
jgi:hypothetical protein